MRLTRPLLFVATLAAASACREAQTEAPARPPLAGVRFINALADTGAVDIQPQDQVEWSPRALALQFRQATQYQPTEAKARRFRMFPTDSNPAITSKFFLDTTVTFEANANYTVLLLGDTRANTERFVVLRDDVPSIPAGQIAIRAINAASGTVNVSLTAAAGDPLPSSPTIGNVAFGGASAYTLRPTGALVARVTTPGSTTVAATGTGPNAPSDPANSAPGTYLPAAGVNSAGSAFSVVYFPRSVSGSRAPQTAAFQAPAAVFFVDRVPQ